VSGFNYRAPAELYASSSKTGKRPMRYTRFKSAAEAIKYAVEELPPELLIGSTLEVNEERFDGFGIRALYDSARYPLRRRKASIPTGFVHLDADLSLTCELPASMFRSQLIARDRA